MKTLILLEVEHDKPLPHLAGMVAGRAWSLPGVTRADVLPTQAEQSFHDMRGMGFTPAEIALGHGEVVRG